MKRPSNPYEHRRAYENLSKRGRAHEGRDSSVQKIGTVLRNTGEITPKPEPNPGELHEDIDLYKNPPESETPYSRNHWYEGEEHANDAPEGVDYI